MLRRFLLKGKYSIYGSMIFFLFANPDTSIIFHRFFYNFVNFIQSGELIKRLHEQNLNGIKLHDLRLHDEKKEIELVNDNENVNNSRNIDKRIEKLLNVLEYKHLKKSYKSKNSTYSLIPIGKMLPLFDYFKVSYPIYSFLETNILKNSNLSIKSLLTLLHLCNILKSHNYGMYRITNIDDSLLFIISIIHFKEKQNILNKSDTCIKFFTVDNLIIPSDENINKELSFFDKNNLYILYTNSDYVMKDIEMNLYDIDFTDVNMSKQTFKINKLDNFSKTPELYLDQLVSLKKYFFNDKELVLSIFIAFKEII